MESMRAREYAPGTINRVLVLLRYGFTLALRWQVEGVECNPVRELIALKEDNKIERFLTREETVRLLKATQHSDNRQLYPIVFFLLLTVARKREALDAKWRDIDWRQRSWRIPRTKSGKVRHVPLSSGALSLLEALKEKCGPASEHIFANPRTGLPFSSVFYSWDTARKEAGLPNFRMHDLRHSFASHCSMLGVPILKIKNMLGHADFTTTLRYSHLAPGELDGITDILLTRTKFGSDQSAKPDSQGAPASRF